MTNKIQFKEIDGLTFYKRKYKNEWVISGIDICSYLGYKNPYDQAKQIYKKFKENFSKTSFLIPLSNYKYRGQITPPKNSFNIQEIRCYNRRGLWFFVSKCNAPRANKLIEGLFEKFDSLIEFLQNTKNKEWIDAREKGKGFRINATDGIQVLEEYATDNGSANAAKYYVNITKMVYKELFGWDKVPKKARDLLTNEQLTWLSLIEAKIMPWIDQCIETKMDYHDIYKKVKDEIHKRVPLMKEISSNSITIG